MNFNPYQYMPQRSIPQVNGLEGAKMYQLGINSQAMLLDNEKPICYIKETDGAGYPTIQAFDLVPHKDEAQLQQESIIERLSALERRLGNESTIKEQSESSDKQFTSESNNGNVQSQRYDTTTARH